MGDEKAGESSSEEKYASVTPRNEEKRSRIDDTERKISPR